MLHRSLTWSLSLAAVFTTNVALAQSVCLPAPRLLTTYPMGGQAGTTVEVKITGEVMEDVEALVFSHPGLNAVTKRDDQGLPVANTYVVTIAPDCPAGIHEARVLTRLGMSSSRAFNVGALPEVVRTTANTSLETSVTLPLNSICNAFMTRQAVDHYKFEAAQGTRVVVDCAAKGIDSKLQPVLIMADEQGNDLVVERRGGTIDFAVPQAGTYVVKVHDLTFNGGQEYFYRLALQQAEPGQSVPRLPATSTVNSFSWPPVGLGEMAAANEVEPNNGADGIQQITLPCDMAGSFFPAADVDYFEFTAKQGEVWWVEVASERFGLPTDPALLVQQVKGEGDASTLVDVVELNDIPSPVKVSSNGYAYDGPPYNAGSTDILGKVEIKEDGKYRLQLTDLFGGTRNDPRNIYRMVIRQAAPDFTIVGWGMHMELRNGDRNALSKPIALRQGSTVAFEVVVVRRDGFDGDIDLELSNLPEGVTATGLKIAAGKSRGILLVSAAQDAPAGHVSATFTGKANINGEVVTRSGHMASMAWPVKDAWGEIPAPRLLADIPVSVSTSEQAPISIAAAEEKVWEVKAGESLTIPLVHVRHSEFSGPKMSLKTFGEGFEGNAAFDVPLDADASEATLDLAKLKTAPGEYTIAFYGSAVAKYRENPEAVTVAELGLKQAQEELAKVTDEVKQLTDMAQQASEAEKSALEQSVKDAQMKQTQAQATVTAAEKTLQQATDRAKPKDIVDIVVSRPIRIRVNPAEAESK